MELQHIAKVASILGLAGTLLKPASKLLGMHAVFNAGIPAVVDAMSSQGSSKAKLAQGARNFTKSFFNPANLTGSVLGYNVIPSIGAKAAGTVGKGMQLLNPSSGFGKFLSGMEKGQGQSMFSNYILGQKAGFIPSMAIGSTVGESASSALTQMPRMQQMKELMLGGGRAPQIK